MKIREHAVDILLRWNHSSLFIDSLLEERAGALDRGERALLEEICIGSLRRRGTLDHLIQHYSRVPQGRIQERVREALRVAMYQILFMEQVPGANAVDLAVGMVKKSFPQWTVSFVNALLRRLVASVSFCPAPPEESFSRSILFPERGRGIYFSEDVLPSPRRDFARFLSAAHSHPKWIVERWLRFFGRDRVSALCRAGNERPAHFLRVNLLKSPREDLLRQLTKDGLAAAESALPWSLRVESPGPLLSHRTFREGWFYLQDETAMRAGAILDPRPGEKVLDLCAAPGGKATHLAERMGNQGSVVAVDSSSERLPRLEENCRRLGLTIVEPLHMDGREAGSRFSGEFHRVMVDVPCSNTGVFRRRAGVRWRIRYRDLAPLTALQSSLLESGFSALREGGVLVYSTCSLEPEEGEERIAAFLESHPRAERLERHLYFPEEGGGDGGFIARIKKQHAGACGSR